MKLGQRGETLVREKIEAFIFKIKLEQATWEQSPNTQRAGIDLFTSIEQATFEVKTRSKVRNDILFELETYGKLGWFYTSKADWIVYLMFNKHQTYLARGYFIPIQTPKLRQFIKTNKHRFESITAYSQKETSQWKTHNIIVPITEFPEGTIFSFINPKSEQWGTNRKLNGFM